MSMTDDELINRAISVLGLDAKDRKDHLFQDIFDKAMISSFCLGYRLAEQESNNGKPS